MLIALEEIIDEIILEADPQSSLKVRLDWEEMNLKYARGYDKFYLSMLHGDSGLELMVFQLMFNIGLIEEMVQPEEFKLIDQITLHYPEAVYVSAEYTDLFYQILGYTQRRIHAEYGDDYCSEFDLR